MQFGTSLSLAFGGVLRACPSIVASRQSSRIAVAWTSTNRLDGVVCRTCSADASVERVMQQRVRAAGRLCGPAGRGCGSACGADGGASAAVEVGGNGAAGFGPAMLSRVSRKDQRPPDGNHDVCRQPNGCNAVLSPFEARAFSCSKTQF